MFSCSLRARAPSPHAQPLILTPTLSHLPPPSPTVLQKRKIACLLCFANLVPLPAAGGLEPLIQPGSGTYLRQLWRCPEGGGSCEVQLIIGKTLAERLGRRVLAF